jgi:hypothetical protein
LSVTHGTVGQSVNPHRMFAMCGMALGVFAIVFLGACRRLWRPTVVRHCSWRSHSSC